MKLESKVISSAFVMAVYLASSTLAVFGDGSLNVLRHEKGRSLSKRGVKPSFPFETMSLSSIRRPNKIRPTYEPTTEEYNDRLMRFFHENTFTVEKREWPRARRSVQELRSLEGLLKTKQDRLTDLLKTLNRGILHHHQNHHQQQAAHGGLPLIGVSSFLMPFGVQTGQNTVLFVHQKPKNNTNATTTNVRPGQLASPGTPAAVVAGVPEHTHVDGSAGPAIAPPVIIVVQAQQNDNSTTESPTTSGSTDGGSTETQGNQTTTGSPSTEADGLKSRAVTPTLSADGEESSSVASEASQTTEAAASGSTTSAGANTTEDGPTVEGSGTSESTGGQHHAREDSDTLNRFLQDDA